MSLTTYFYFENCKHYDILGAFKNIVVIEVKLMLIFPTCLQEVQFPMWEIENFSSKKL